MIIPDINLIVYAYDERSPYHQPARRWWIDLLNGDEETGLPWIVVSGFVRIITHPRIMSAPQEPLDAIERVARWLSRPNVRLIEPGPDHLAMFRRNLAALSSGGNDVPDEQLATFVIERGAEFAYP